MRRPSSFQRTLQTPRCAGGIRQRWPHAWHRTRPAESRSYSSPSRARRPSTSTSAVTAPTSYARSRSPSRRAPRHHARRVADHAVHVARHVARRHVVEHARAVGAELARRPEHSRERADAARLPRALLLGAEHRVGVESLHAPQQLPVEPVRDRLRVIVRQIGARDEERRVPAQRAGERQPERAWDVATVVAKHHRHEPPLLRERPLQQRQLDLDRVLRVAPLRREAGAQLRSPSVGAGPGYNCPAIGEGRTSTGLTFPSRYCHPARGEDRGCLLSDENGRGATETAARIPERLRDGGGWSAGDAARRRLLHQRRALTRRASESTGPRRWAPAPMPKAPALGAPRTP